MARRIRPIATSDCVWSPPLASLNVTAILDAMVWAWSKIDTGMSWPLPITIVTAIVSPSARPRPRIAAPTTPERAYGSTALTATSQRVAPRPNIASRWLFGTELSTSREIETIVGRIMIARITPAAPRPTPKLGPWKKGSQPSVAMSQESTVSRRNGLSTKMPHSPITTLGIAASSSIVNVSGIATRRGANSDRKIAVRTPIGVAMSRAIAAA
jgi:hypothetical protein